MPIIKFEEKHLLEAANLFIELYKRQRINTPNLPDKYESTDNIKLLFERMIKRNYPVLAYEEDGKLIGYMMAHPIIKFKGNHNGLLIPEWGHAAIFDKRLKIYQELFKSLSTEFVKKSYYNLAVQVLDYDKEEQDFWFWNGFGMIVIDAVRDLKEINVKNDNIKVNIATITDLSELMKLVHDHQKHYPTSPIFLPVFKYDEEQEYIDLIEEDNANIWIAKNDNEYVGYIIGKRSNTNAEILEDINTLSIIGAYVTKEYRGQDIASLLLSNIIEWAKKNSYQRLGVDFESANIQGRSLWLRHFKPVVYALIRHVDDRMDKSI